MQTFFLLLLALTPITIAGSKLGFPSTALFCLVAIVIIPLARFIGQATEELSGWSGPAVGGLLNATFGNAPELLIGTFAIRLRLIDVVKASITGSLTGNLLLVLGRLSLRVVLATKPLHSIAAAHRQAHPRCLWR
jgi:Ca2+:H+ antiporter